MEKEKSKLFSFEFWQKFGKALLVVVAVMPAAGLMICIGKLIGMSGNLALVQTIARVVEDLGWGIIGNLHILFAVAIGGSWAKERAGGAFAAIIAFILTNRITGAIFGVNGAMLLDPKATVISLITADQRTTAFAFMSSALTRSWLVSLPEITSLIDHTNLSGTISLTPLNSLAVKVVFPSEFLKIKPFVVKVCVL